MGQRVCCPQRLQMLVLRLRIPHHVLTTLYALTIPPLNHQGTRLHISTSSTLNRATLRHRHDPDSGGRRACGKDTQTRPFHPRLLVARHNRLHHPHLDSKRASAHILRRDHLRRSRHLPLYGNRALMARGKRIRTDETRDCDGDDHHNRQSGRRAGNAAVQTCYQPALVPRPRICIGVSGGESAEHERAVVLLEQGE